MGYTYGIHIFIFEHCDLWPHLFTCTFLSTVVTANDCENANIQYNCEQMSYCPSKCSSCSMSDKSELKAELERKKQRIAQIREEKKRKEEEKKKKDVSAFSVL